MIFTLEGTATHASKLFCGLLNKHGPSCLLSIDNGVNQYSSEHIHVAGFKPTLNGFDLVPLDVKNTRELVEEEVEEECWELSQMKSFITSTLPIAKRVFYLYRVYNQAPTSIKTKSYQSPLSQTILTNYPT